MQSAFLVGHTICLGKGQVYGKKLKDFRIYDENSSEYFCGSKYRYIKIPLQVVIRQMKNSLLAAVNG